MVTLTIFNIGSTEVSWDIDGLSNPFNRTHYRQAGVATSRVSGGQTTAPSGIRGSVSAPTTGTANWVSGRATGLPANTTQTLYGFVQVASGSYWPAGSSTFTTKEDIVFPGPPTNISSSVSGRNITISFTKGANATSTRLDVPWSGTQQTTTGSSFPTVTAPSYSTTYQFFLASQNASGWSDWVPHSATTGAAPGSLPAVSTLSASNITHNSATLRGDLTSTGNLSTETGFRYYWSGIPGGSPIVVWNSPTTSTGTFSYVLDVSSAHGASINYRALARNSQGTVEASSPANFIVPHPPAPVPSAPTYLWRDGVTGTSIDLYCSAVDHATSYKYWVRIGGTWEERGSATSATTRVSITGLSQGTEYRFGVQACNASGCSSRTERNFTTSSTPAAPTNLRATSTSQTQITMACDTVGGTTGYQWFRNGIYQAETTTNSYTFTNLTPNGVQYTFGVRACNDVGCSSTTSQSASTSYIARPSSISLSSTSSSVTAQIGSVSGEYTDVRARLYYKADPSHSWGSVQQTKYGSPNGSVAFTGLSHGIWQVRLDTRLTVEGIHYFSTIRDDFITIDKPKHSTPPRPTVSNITHNSAVLTAGTNSNTNIRVYRYWADGDPCNYSQVQKNGTTFTGLCPNREFHAWAWTPEDSNYAESESSLIANFLTPRAPQSPPQHAPWLASDLEPNRIHLHAEAGTWIMLSNGVEKQRTVSGAVWTAADGIQPNTTYTAYAYFKEKADHFASTPGPSSEFTTPKFTRAAPTNLQVQVSGQTVTVSADGGGDVRVAIVGVSEAKTSPGTFNLTGWCAEIGYAYAYFVETSTHYRSINTEMRAFTTGKCTQSKPVPPTYNNLTWQTVTLNHTDASNPRLRIHMNGLTQTAGSSWPVIAGQEHNAFAQYIGTDRYEASELSLPLAFTAPAKPLEPRDPPLPPVATGIKSDSAVLTSNAGSIIILGNQEKPSGSLWEGLQASTTYIAYAYFPQTSTHERSPNSSPSQFTTLPAVQRPANFEWQNPKVKGEPVATNMTAVEWSQFATAINNFREYKSMGKYSFTSVLAGDDFLASIFNQAVLAILDMNPLTSPPSLKSKGDDVLANYFAQLKNSLNSIE